MIETREQQIRDNLKRLAAIHATTMSMHEEYIAILQAELDALSRPKQTAPSIAIPSVDPDQPIVDRSVMCVVYRGKQCFLGNSLKLKFLERLARRPNQYVSYEALLNDVWNGIREPSTIRSIVKDIRAKLRAADMTQLSDAIDGHVAGYYGLMLNGAK